MQHKHTKKLQTLILKPGRERSLINRHPWVFSGAVKTLPQAQNGEIIKVCTNDDKLLGYGFFSPKSQITCRVFEFTSEVITIDANFWIGKIQRAYDLRKLVLPKNTNMYRLLFAEGDFFPGVIIDVYADTAVVQFMIKGTEFRVYFTIDFRKYF